MTPRGIKYFILFLILIFLAAAGFLLFKTRRVLPPPPTAIPPLTPTSMPTSTPTPTPKINYEAIGPCQKAPILMYHHVSQNAASLNVDTEVFQKQMDYLVQQSYNVISFGQMVDGVIAGGGLPAKPIVISFDDGYQDFYTDAWPILQAHGFPVILFLTTGLVGSSDDYLTWDQVKQMNSSGLLTVGNHTWSHQNLGSGSREKLEYEVKTASDQITDYLGQRPVYFAFPFGTVGNLPILQEQGIKAAVVTYPRLQCARALYFFGRQRVGNSSLSAYGL